MGKTPLSFLRDSELKILLLATITLCGLHVASAAYPEDCKEDGSCCRPVLFMDNKVKSQGIVFGTEYSLPYYDKQARAAVLKQAEEDLAHALAKGYQNGGIRETSQIGTRRRCWIGYGNKPDCIVENFKAKRIVEYLEKEGDSELEAHSPASAGSHSSQTMTNYATCLGMNGDAYFHAPDMPTSPPALPDTKPNSRPRRKAARKRLRKQRDAGSDSSHEYGDLTMPEDY